MTTRLTLIATSLLLIATSSTWAIDTTRTGGSARNTSNVASRGSPLRDEMPYFNPTNGLQAGSRGFTTTVMASVANSVGDRTSVLGTAPSITSGKFPSRTQQFSTFTPLRQTAGVSRPIASFNSRGL